MRKLCPLLTLIICMLLVSDVSAFSFSQRQLCCQSCGLIFYFFKSFLEDLVFHFVFHKFGCVSRAEKGHWRPIKAELSLSYVIPATHAQSDFLLFSWPKPGTCPIKLFTDVISLVEQLLVPTIYTQVLYLLPCLEPSWVKPFMPTLW